MIRFREEKARDSLSFDPLPPCSRIIVGEDGIEVRVPYSEALSRLLGRIPGAYFYRDQCLWKLPFSAAENLRKIIPSIESLARLAEEQGASMLDDAPRPAPKPKKTDTESQRKLQSMLECRTRLKTEYLDAMGAFYPVTLEAIGDDTASQYRMFGFAPRQWVAQIMGRNKRNWWVRYFLRGSKDYSRSNSIGSRGIMVTYMLENGPIYEIKSPQTWRSSDRYFARVVGGEIIRMTEEQVIECLEK